MIIKIFKEYAAAIKSVDEEERSITALVSTGEQDRVGEYIPPEEWKLMNYEKNPVILWAHNYSQPPVAKALWTKTDKKGLIQKIQFAKTDFANDIFELYKGGFLNAFSVGFQADRDSEDSKIFRNAELLEVSCVPVPCNANALMERAASGLIKSQEGLAFVKTFEKEEVIKTDPPAAAEPVVKESSFTRDLMDELKNITAENEVLKKSLDELFNLKEGRVLSKRNRDLIQSAVSALKELLDATDPATDDEAEKTLDKSNKFVIISDKKIKDAPAAPGISAEDLKAAVKSVNVAGIVRREIKRIKGEVE